MGRKIPLIRQDSDSVEVDVGSSDSSEDSKKKTKKHKKHKGKSTKPKKSSKKDSSDSSDSVEVDVGIGCDWESDSMPMPDCPICFEITDVVFLVLHVCTVCLKLITVKHILLLIQLNVKNFKRWKLV